MTSALSSPFLIVAALPDFFAPFRAWLHIRHDVSDTLVLFSLAFARWAPVFSMTPFIGGRLVPGSVRVGLAVMMSLWMIPGLSASTVVPMALSAAAFWVLMLKEILVGFVLSFAGGLVFWAAEMGGKFIDNVRGTTTANLLIPQVSTQSSLLGDFYFQLFIVLYCLAGGHRLFLSAVFQSYEAIPPLAPELGTQGLATSAIAATGELWVVALKITAPALIVLMLMDLMLGVANRMAPQLDVFFISLSLKASVGSLVVALSLYYLLGMTPEMFKRQQEWTVTIVEGMRPRPAPAAAPTPAR
jgi:flagellar biosynthetic protein FliR